jgi:hypothetical protein
MLHIENPKKPKNRLPLIATRFGCLIGGTRGGSEQCFLLTDFLPLHKRKILKT